MRSLPILTLLVVLAQTSGSFAGEPARLLPYQGRVAPGAGPQVLRFALFDAPSAGSRLWGTEEQAVVPAADGSFFVQIGGTAVDDCARVDAELIENGDFERGGGSLSGWTVASGAWAAADRLGGVGAWSDRFFAAAGALTGPAGETVELFQEASLAALAGPIASGGQSLGFSARVNGVLDTARVILELRDAGGAVLDSFDSGVLSPGDRWVPVSDGRVAPPGAVAARVRLQGTHVGGTVIDASFDEVSLRGVHQSGPELACGGLGDGVPDLDQLDLGRPLYLEVRSVVATGLEIVLGPRQIVRPAFSAVTTSGLGRPLALEDLVSEVRALLLPTGTVIAWPGDPERIPDGWLPCDGGEYPRSELPDLADRIGDIYPGSTPETFRVPDYRGRFLRGTQTPGAAGRDPDAGSRAPMFPGSPGGDQAGSVQGFSTAVPVDQSDWVVQGEEPCAFSCTGHVHVVTTSQIAGSLTDGGWGLADFDPEFTFQQDLPVHGTHAHDGVTGGDAETRPVNAAVTFLIRY